VCCDYVHSFIFDDTAMKTALPGQNGCCWQHVDVSHLTHHSLPLSAHGPDAARQRPEAAAWILSGVVAAGLGLGALTVLVLLLWIISPYPDSGAGGALHIAADLWLLSQGGHLQRTETLSGSPAPVALTPLLLALLPGWLLFRACVQALAENAERGPRRESGGRTAESSAEPSTRPSTRPSTQPSTRPSVSRPPGRDGHKGRGRSAPALTAVGWVVFGYLLTGAIAVLYASSGPVRADVPSAALWLPLFAVCVAGLAVWLGAGRGLLASPVPAPARRPAPAPTPASGAELAALARERQRALPPGPPPHGPRPLRAALAATGALCAGGLVLVFGSVLWHWHAVQSSFPQLTGSWSGRFAVLLLALALLPNAALWSAAYALGPGFALGTGTSVGLLGAGGDPRLPPFPLLATLPGEGQAGAPAWALACALPLAAGLALGWSLGRTSVPVRGSGEHAVSPGETMRAAGLAACGCGSLMALLAGFAGGALGTDELARFGPGGWSTGAAALVWTAAVGLPGALIGRLWRMRELPAHVVAAALADAMGGGWGAPEGWHDQGSRGTRWTAVKAASGGLMPDFEPVHD
jgi:hypothetical protein